MSSSDLDSSFEVIAKKVCNQLYLRNRAFANRFLLGRHPQEPVKRTRKASGARLNTYGGGKRAKTTSAAAKVAKQNRSKQNLNASKWASMLGSPPPGSPLPEDKENAKAADLNSDASSAAASGSPLKTTKSSTRSKRTSKASKASS